MMYYEDEKGAGWPLSCLDSPPCEIEDSVSNEDVELEEEEGYNFPSYCSSPEERTKVENIDISSTSEQSIFEYLTAVNNGDNSSGKEIRDSYSLSILQQQQLEGALVIHEAGTEAKDVERYCSSYQTSSTSSTSVANLEQKRRAQRFSSPEINYDRPTSSRLPQFRRKHSEITSHSGLPRLDWIKEISSQSESLDTDEEQERLTEKYGLRPSHPGWDGEENVSIGSEDSGEFYAEEAASRKESDTSAAFYGSAVSWSGQGVNECRRNTAPLIRISCEGAQRIREKGKKHITQQTCGSSPVVRKDKTFLPPPVRAYESRKVDAINYTMNSETASFNEPELWDEFSDEFFSNRPRLLTFPSSRSKAGSADNSPSRRDMKPANQWSKMDRWESVPKSQLSKRASISVTKNISFAEREFLSSAISDNFDKLRSFSVTKKGQVIDCGYCYRDRNVSNSSSPAPGPTNFRRRGGSPGDDNDDDDEEEEYENYSSNSPRKVSPNLDKFRKTSAGRRCTCPDIWLTRAESFTPSSVRECDVWVTGMAEVGKSTLITQLCKVAWDLEASVGSKGPNEWINGLSVSFLVDGEEILVRFREGSPAEVRLLQDENKPCAYLVLYTIDNKASFKRMIDILSVLLSNQKNSREKAPVVIVGNKEDLQRRRVVNPHEAKAIAKIYRCQFQEVSCSMGLHMDELLKALVLQVQGALKSHQIARQPMVSGNDESEMDMDTADLGRKSSLIRRIKSNGRRLVKSCEELFFRRKK